MHRQIQWAQAAEFVSRRETAFSGNGR